LTQRLRACLTTEAVFAQHYPIFAESESMEAQALYDFSARSAREVNFHKGDTVTLFKQVSNDWWKGAVRGQEGLIPDKYIMLKIK
jgi:SLIT-ROBO Rho GTPase activating protein